ncbi:hypothetical protein LK994_03325 [Ferruginibacter lapsinanis]|uniref:POTRA domain-containing protein n=1 Tax=Ferruginibacter lapsinanis TaxID=563172 RepID=UPI001E5F3DD6|nr:POTRA domain-containing protein [Ferruginibacter lapsinanis]UEG50506.1 hypothetical protein LK994_03325 [Ferruginibacter lapsinanis]
MNVIKKIFFCFLAGAFSILSQKAKSQSVAISNDQDTAARRFQVKEIKIIGNKKTKGYIIKREMLMREGDYIDSAALPITLEKSRQFIYNTTLFNEVKVTADTLPNNLLVVSVEVKERWYIFPVPQFQWVDRNLNDWLNNHNGDLSRVNYGLKFAHYNLTGRRDQLRITALNGYTRNISFSYSQPYSNSALTEGFSVGIGFTQNREIVYKTSYDNKLLFLKSEDFSNQRFFVNTAYTLRRGITERHTFSLSFSGLSVNDSVITSVYNPSYFNSTSSRQNIIDLSYTYQFTDVDNISYPLVGKVYSGTVSKRGLKLKGDINSFQIDGRWSKYSNMKKNWYSSLETMGKINMPFDQAYINQRSFGYGEAYLRGLENYVIDGVAYALAKSTLKKKLLYFRIRLPFKAKTISSLPVTIFAKTYADFGYVYTQNQYDTYLSNRFLYTVGAGIDILTTYDATLRLEYSFNQLGQNGLFLRMRSSF